MSTSNARASLARGPLPVLFSLVLALVLALPAPGVAQETTAGIRGKVINPNGQPIVNTRVIVEDTRTGIQRSYSTNNSGTFLAARLPVGGPYSVTVEGSQPVTVNSLELGDNYALTITLQAVEEVVVTGTTSQVIDVAAGPAATFSSYDIGRDVAFNRDIVDVYGLDPRLNIDADDRNFQVNCAGKHPRFNSVTLDGVSQSDRFGLNTNGYSTATGLPFPFDAIQQIAVELAPFDVSYGGFSACNINTVTKSGTNEWSGKGWFEFTNDNLRGDTIGALDEIVDSPKFNDRKRGASIGGPLIQDRLFFFGAYEESEVPRFIGMGFAGSGNGTERDWLDASTYNRVNTIARDIYNYDTGGQPADGEAADEKYLVRLDWNISQRHNAALIYNYYDGFENRASDGDQNEFEFANHFYTKGAESETSTLILESQWTDAFSTEFFLSKNEMNDSQITVGPKDFGDHQITVETDDGRNTIYLGADDSRQANSLNTESEFIKLKGQWLYNDHVMSFGFESEELTIFNIFVQHSRGGEYDYFDDSADNDPGCAALSAQERFDGVMGCSPSGVDRFELGRPSRIYYGSGGGTNNPNDAAAMFANRLNSLYFQDEIQFSEHDLTVVGGLRYDWFTSDDRPVFNGEFTDASGIRNDANVDGLDLFMPRFGFTWEPRENVSVRGGLGRYSGGNPNVWISNAWSNDGVTNVQLQLRNFGGDITVLPGMPDSEPLSGAMRPGYDVPQSLVDDVADTTADNASDSNIVLLDPNYKQPSEWKAALGASFRLPWWDIHMDVDYLHTRAVDPAYYTDVSQVIDRVTPLGIPVYRYSGDGEDNLMLTNSSFEASADIVSMVLQRGFDNGIDLTFGYAYTDAEEVAPMTSFVASSNFTNQAIVDINNPRPGTSNYVVPHRFTFQGGWAGNLFGDNQTRVTLRGTAAQGQPQSYVMSSAPFDASEPQNGRHLLYIPDGTSDPNVEFASDFPTTDFFAWAKRENLGPGFVSRNKRHGDWSTIWNLRLDQEIPTFIPGTKGQIFAKIYNIGNLINDEWGRVNDAFFFPQEVAQISLTSDDRLLFEDFSDRGISDTLETRSLWSARVGFSIEF